MKSFYITTPIYYVNSDPHVGSAYTTLHADLLSRFYKLNNYNSKFLTGTDEHGQKIQQSAEKNNKKPQEFVDEISVKFRTLIKTMNCKPDYFETLNDDFIRTTMPCHELFVQEVWKKMVENGWVYRGKYSGWYCVSDEAYYGEDELIKGEDGKMRTELGKEAEWKEEDSYFFRLSDFQNILLKLYKKYPNFVEPVGKKTEVISFVSGLSMKEYENGVEPKKDYLKDLSVSRNTFEWGIKIPCDENGKELLDKDGNWKADLPQGEKHVIYVWFDALFNYISALGCPANKDYDRYWLNCNNKVHLVGKDILRPHAVYWPAFLIAFNYKRDELLKMNDLPENIDKFLPTTIFAHGWLTNEGLKISKSLGNAIIPANEIEWLKNTYNISEEIATDYLRYYLITFTSFGGDGDYSKNRLVEKINAELANKVGNLAKRSLDMIYKNCNAEIPQVKDFDTIYSNSIFDECEKYIKEFKFDTYVSLIMKFADDVNKYMDEKAPWVLKKEEKIEEMEKALYSIVNSVKNIAILLQPVCPYIANKILKELGLNFEENLSFDELNKNIESGLKIEKPSIIIPRLQVK